MANAPTFKSVGSRTGIPIIPIVLGVVLIVAIAAFTLTRDRVAPPSVAAPSADDLHVTTIGRPPEPTVAPVAEPEATHPEVTIDRPEEAAAAPRERRKPPVREPVVRQPRPAGPPVREAARSERPGAAARPAPEPVQVQVSTPARAVEPDPPLPPPPQFVAAPTQAPPTASAPLAIGRDSAREGAQKARPATPGCVIASLRLPRDIADVGGESASVKFAVDETGQVSQFSYLAGPADSRLSNAIWAAVQRCQWVPGTNAQGRPITLWVTMPIKFGR
jgi:TonB family protein